MVPFETKNSISSPLWKAAARLRTQVHVLGNGARSSARQANSRRLLANLVETVIVSVLAAWPPLLFRLVCMGLVGCHACEQRETTLELIPFLSRYRQLNGQYRF
jgi:hypothetical protein